MTQLGLDLSRTELLIPEFQYNVKATLYNGRAYRSRTEAKLACVFDELGIPFEYEPRLLELDPVHLEAQEITFNLSVHMNHGYIHCRPDIFLTGFKHFVELVGPNITALKEVQLRIISTRYPVILCQGGLPTIIQLQNGEPLKEQCTLYLRDIMGQRKYDNMYLSECSECGEIAFLHTCSCFHVTYGSNPWATERILDAYRVAYKYPFVDYVGEIEFSKGPEERI